MHGPLDTIRTDQVGSLLRPQQLKDATLGFARDEVSAQQLAAVQDEAIRELLRLEDQHHLDVLTDGEFRRASFTDSLMGSVGGIESTRWAMSEMVRDPMAGKTTTRVTPPSISAPWRVTAPLSLEHNQPLREYDFAREQASRPLKVTLLNLDRIIQTFDRESAEAFYPTLDDFVNALIKVAREIIAGLVQAGCPYVSIDAPAYTAYVDEIALERMRSKGEDPAKSLARAIQIDNQLIEDFEDVTFGAHLCRGNRQSMWHREGSYEAIAEQLFNGLAHQRLLLEYDTARAGGFEPLRFVPKGKVAVLGLITTKTGEVETVDQLKRRIDEATRFLPLDQLAISPQCGFSSGLAGNLLSEDEEWRKLDVMMETARQIWG